MHIYRDKEKESFNHNKGCICFKPRLIIYYICKATNLHHLFMIIFHWSHATFMFLSFDIHTYIYIYTYIYMMYDVYIYEVYIYMM